MEAGWVTRCQHGAIASFCCVGVETLDRSLGRKIYQKHAQLLAGIHQLDTTNTMTSITHHHAISSIASNGRTTHSKGITELGTVGWLLGGNGHGSFICIAWNMRPRRSCTLPATATGRQCRLCFIAWAQQRLFHFWEQELSNSFETAWTSNLSHKTLPLITVHIKRK